MAAVSYKSDTKCRSSVLSLRVSEKAGQFRGSELVVPPLGSRLDGENGFFPSDLLLPVRNVENMVPQC